MNLAASNGCDVLAITDHADHDLEAATPAYADAIHQARSEHPELLVLAGLEWNVPPYDRDEHATVLVAPGDDEWRTLAEFKARFDDFEREDHLSTLADDALRWLGDPSRRELQPVVFLNHPSRSRGDSLSVVDDIVQWRTNADLVIGLSGSPGHQRGVPLGAYGGTLSLIDRWDPAVATVGGAWDQLLQQGLDVWGARAPSDAHEAVLDFWPCEFSETWLYAPERTAAGVMEAFRAGSFFAVHGQIASEVELSVEADGLTRPALAGETLTVPAEMTISASLRFRVPATDWAGQPNRIDAVELIEITQGGATVVASRPPEYADAAATFVEALTVPVGGLVLRARGRRIVPNGPDLMFYTNPIRVVTP